MKEEKKKQTRTGYLSNQTPGKSSERQVSGSHLVVWHEKKE